MKVCVLGDAVHCEQAQMSGIPFKSADDLKKLNLNKKLGKKLAQSFDAFLASQVVIPQIPRLLGPALHKLGKFPTLIVHTDNLLNKVGDIRSPVKVHSIGTGNSDRAEWHDEVDCTLRSTAVPRGDGDPPGVRSAVDIFLGKIGALSADALADALRAADLGSADSGNPFVQLQRDPVDPLSTPQFRRLSAVVRNLGDRQDVVHGLFQRLAALRLQ